MPTSMDTEYNARCWPEYAAAVRAAGGEPLQISLQVSAAELKILCGECSGFVLPGSPADVDPASYGQGRADATAASDSFRESCDRLLLEYAETSGKPVLGICFGMQVLNVWRGGTLIQDVSPVPLNHSAGASVAVAHAVLVEAESLLGGLLSRAEAPAEGEGRRLGVNSSHHQAVALLGEDLVMTAQSAQDGVIEALEGRVGSAAVIGVQWHPERSYERSAASRALFLWLVSEAMDHLEREAEGASSF